MTFLIAFLGCGWLHLTSALHPGYLKTIARGTDGNLLLARYGEKTDLKWTYRIARQNQIME